MQSLSLRPQQSAVSTRLPLIEGLETRALFSAHVAGPVGPSAVPDFQAAITSQPPPAVLPGTAIKMAVRISNSGGSMASAASVPIAVFLTDEGSVDGQEPLAVVPISLRLKGGQSKNCRVQFTVPAGLPEQGYFMYAQVNFGNAVVEQDLDNNVVASSFLANPIGHYSGQITDGTDSVDFGFDIDGLSGSSVLTSFAGSHDSIFGSIDVQDVRSTLTPDGKYTLKFRGTAEDTALGNFTFSIAVNAQFSGNTLSGTMFVQAVLEDSGPVAGRVGFTVTKDAD